MRISGAVLAFGGACAILAGVGVWARGGELNPPPGPVAPTMKSLDEISAQISAIQAVTGGAPVKRVIRGVIALPSGQTQKTQSFSPAVDPAKSVVALSPALYISWGGSINALISRNGAGLTDLTADTISIAVDGHTHLTQQVSFQIIEYN